MSIENGFRDTRLDTLAAKLAERNGLPSTANILTNYLNQGADAHWRRPTSILIENGRKLSTQELRALGEQDLARSKSEMVDFNDLEG